MNSDRKPSAEAMKAEVPAPDPYHIERARLAYQTIAAFGWSITWRHDKPVPDDAWPIDIIAKSILAAERRGEERMRERTAEYCADYAMMIRSLPLTPEPGQ